MAGGPALPVIPHLVIRTDGAARGNPGPASLGAVLIDGSRADALDPSPRPTPRSRRRWASRRTTWPSGRASSRPSSSRDRLGAEKVDLFLDSKLIVEQLHGRWRVKDLKLQPLHAEAKGLLGGFRRW